MKVPGAADDWKPVPVGVDGVAVLLLSVAVAVGTAGSSLMLALAVVLRTAWRTPTEVPGQFGAVAVLGQRLDTHGRPTPAFQRRLRRGRAVAAHQAVVHVLGGITRPPFPSEAAVGRSLLLDEGMAAHRVVAEQRSRHTLENLRALRASLPAGGPPVVLVTCRAHLARAGLMAQAMRLPHVLCAAEDHLSPRPGLLHEAALLHWHQTGWLLARVARLGWLARRIG